ncbi:transaldolase [Sporichthya sp.]|uniref:transaldolase n=1 Tax=Sporichthya sp. TaxID=65475 RepID=UPI00179A0423|nr:transaldolase [Sporichthya sp.]MBA3744629.1 transaldolase [Sporichthya sp.]
MTDNLRRLSAAGVAIWLDDLSRERLQTGTLAELVRDSYVVGVTTNPSIFQAAVSKSDLYDPQILDLAVRGVHVDEAVRSITTADVREACDVLRPVYDATDGVDGRVSIEVDPRFATETAKTIAEARALWWAVDRPNLYIKIPATEAGLPAIAQCLAEGISVNVTLIFSLARYRDVMDAFLDGIERAQKAGLPLERIGSVASFFVSRVDSEIDKRLDKLGTAQAKALRGKAAVANARLAFEAYEEVFATSRWGALAAAGAKPQRPLWASTGVKDPAYADTLYVDDLVAAGTVNTMPEATLDAVADHSAATGDTVRAYYADARQVLADLAGIGISYDEVVDRLEREGVEKFVTAWNDLLASVGSELTRLGADS